MRLITVIKEGESIEKALKKHKKKLDRTRVIRELRQRQQYIKPSKIRRNKILEAQYKERIRSKEEE
ncbi:MAG: 30S ribosomal protein S21 [Flavobacteriales bacterium AspAUS03]